MARDTGSKGSRTLMHEKSLDRMTVDSLASKFLQSKKRVVGDVDGLEWGGFAGILECMMDYGEEEEEKKENSIFHEKGEMMLDLFVKGKLPQSLLTNKLSLPCLFHTLPSSLPKIPPIFVALPISQLSIFQVQCTLHPPLPSSLGRLPEQPLRCTFASSGRPFLD